MKVRSVGSLCVCVYLVDPAEWGHIHSLSPDRSSSADTGGVFTWAAVNDGVHQNLQGVLNTHKHQTLVLVLPETHTHTHRLDM